MYIDEIAKARAEREAEYDRLGLSPVERRAAEDKYHFEQSVREWQEAQAAKNAAKNTPENEMLNDLAAGLVNSHCK